MWDSLKSPPTTTPCGGNQRGSGGVRVEDVSPPAAGTSEQQPREEEESGSVDKSALYRIGGEVGRVAPCMPGMAVSGEGGRTADGLECSSRLKRHPLLYEQKSRSTSTMVMVRGQESNPRRESVVEDGRTMLR